MNKINFNPSDFINDKEMAAIYLQTALEEDGINGFLEALSDVSKSKGMSEMAKNINVGRQSLYKSLSKDGKPAFETISKILNEFNLKFSVTSN